MAARASSLVVSVLFALSARGASSPVAPASAPSAAPASLLAAADGDVASDLRASQRRTDAALARRAALVDAAARADAGRDAAAARVAALKGAASRDQRALEAALRAALEADERAAAARSAVAGADAVVAQEGAQLLAQYDRALVVRRAAIDRAPAGRRADAIATWRALAAQRDAVRHALAPVLAPTVRGDDDADLRGLDVDDNDDVEALLEKVDLARDLEARLRRRAEAVRARIRELRDERAVAADVAASVGRASLFDEEDRRLLLNRADLGGTRPESDKAPSSTTTSSSTTAPGGPSAAELDGVAAPANPAAPAADAPTIVVDAPGTAERGYGPGMGLAPGDGRDVDDGSLAALQALDARLQGELRALAQKQAALKKATTSRSSTTR